MARLLLRGLLLLAGLLLAAGLLALAVLLLAGWAVRATWARLSGRPVQPWAMRWHPGAGLQRFRRDASPGRPEDGGPARFARARALGPAADDVSDVHARPVAPKLADKP